MAYLLGQKGKKVILKFSKDYLEQNNEPIYPWPQVIRERVSEDNKEKLFNYFEQGEYEKALEVKREASEKYAGNSLQAKFDYLQALIIGKTKGKDAYVTALQRIVELYPA